MRFISVTALTNSAPTLYHNPPRRKQASGLLIVHSFPPTQPAPYSAGREDEGAEFFLQAQFFSVVLENRTCGGVLIHQNVFPAKGARNHLHDGENLRSIRPAQAEPDPRSVAAIDDVARPRIPRDVYALPSAGTGERLSPLAHAASPSSASIFARSKPTTFSSPMKITGVARMLALRKSSSRASSS